MVRQQYFDALKQYFRGQKNVLHKNIFETLERNFIQQGKKNQYVGKMVQPAIHTTIKKCTISMQVFMYFVFTMSL